MTCPRCRKTIEEDAPRCPYCGQGDPGANGLYQTSVVRIAAGAADLVYRSVEEVPPPLRQKLLDSTSSPNSATILIADRRGRLEIAKAVRALPGPLNRRLGPRAPAANSSRLPAWLAVGRPKAILIALGILVLSAIACAFHQHW